jgi:SAM-dependent methyltransferase
MGRQDDRARWDQRYREGSHASLEPDPFLVEAASEFIEPLFPHAGTALDIAGGVGRHAIWLAERGWQVTILDFSEAALAQARANAAKHRDQIEFRPTDLTTFEASSTYDLVLAFFYLEREIFPALLASLRPGGLLVYKTYTRLQPKFGGGPTHPMYLLEENELLRAFPGLSVLYYQETVRDRGVAELIGRKPLP